MRFEMWVVLTVNPFQYPAVIVPFTTADPAKDPKPTDFKPLCEFDVEVQAKCEYRQYENGSAAISDSKKNRRC